MATHTEVAVVGAGITGLTTAYYLHRAGVPVALFEASGRVGGTLRTVHESGYRVELGPNTLVQTPAVRQLFADLGLTPAVREANPAHNTRYLLRRGRLHGLHSPRDLLLGGLLSLGGRLRVLQEPFRPPLKGPNPTVHAFFAHRLGTEAAQVLVSAFVAGVWAGSPQALEMRSAFRALWADVQHHGSLFKALSAQRKAQQGQPKATICSLSEGLSQLTDTLAEHLGPSLHLRSELQALAPSPGGYSLRFNTPNGPADWTCQHLVLAVPAAQQAHLLQPHSPTLADGLRAIPHPAVRVVHVGYPTEAVGQRLDGFGFLVPQGEGTFLLGAIWNSAQFADCAPPGHVLFTLFGGGSRTPTTPTADELIAEFASRMGIRALPDYVRDTLWPRAIPQYTLGHAALEAQATALEPQGLHVVGNWRGGIGLPDCIANAQALARRLSQSR